MPQFIAKILAQLILSGGFARTINGNRVGTSFSDGYYLINKNLVIEDIINGEEYTVTFEKGDIVYAYSDIEKIKPNPNDIIQITEKEYIHIIDKDNNDVKFETKDNEHKLTYFTFPQEISNLESQMDDDYLDEQIEEKLSNDKITKISDLMYKYILWVGIGVFVLTFLLLIIGKGKILMMPFVILACLYVFGYFILILLKAIKSIKMKNDMKLALEQQIFNLNLTGDEPSCIVHQIEENSN